MKLLQWCLPLMFLVAGCKKTEEISTTEEPAAAKGERAPTEGEPAAATNERSVTEAEPLAAKTELPGTESGPVAAKTERVATESMAITAPAATTPSLGLNHARKLTYPFPKDWSINVSGRSAVYVLQNCKVPRRTVWKESTPGQVMIHPESLDDGSKKSMYVWLSTRELATNPKEDCNQAACPGCTAALQTTDPDQHCCPSQ